MRILPTSPTEALKQRLKENKEAELRRLKRCLEKCETDKARDIVRNKIIYLLNI